MSSARGKIASAFHFNSLKAPLVISAFHLKCLRVLYSLAYFTRLLSLSAADKFSVSTSLESTPRLLAILRSKEGLRNVLSSGLNPANSFTTGIRLLKLDGPMSFSAFGFDFYSEQLLKVCQVHKVFVLLSHVCFFLDPFRSKRCCPNCNNSFLVARVTSS